MEDQKKEWKNYIVLREGAFWVVRNFKREVGGRFTTKDRALQYIESQRNDFKRKLYKRELRKIRKLPIAIRKRKYLELCQIVESI